jgi:molecular chaperone GrpE (heat shock protein)
MSGSASARRAVHGHSKSLMNSQELTSTGNKANDDLINFLEHKLQEIENKLSRTQIEYDQLQQDYLQLQDKLHNNKEKYKRAALLLTEFLDDLLKKQPSILQNDKDMHLNLDKL